MIELKPDLLISAASALFALLSAAFALHSARQAKRQADAVLGDIPPSFSVYQRDFEEFTSHATIVIEIVNHNRRPMLIHELALDYREGIIVFEDGKDTASAIISLLRASRNRAHRFDIPLRLAGCGPNMQPEKVGLTFCCSWQSEVPRRPVEFGVRGEFLLDGDRTVYLGYGSTIIEPPKHGW
ncbi:hypothetical protein [Rhizobium paknamense]|uniref:Uncharacterized protein n=1 Tax=Rhizobium paknamense TaxID=1206817 RepID=A0ABU0I8Y3_9HYPH|nr:hypothetical protein [Rhizobium paknamense]MDQ0454691.1 hypothetical protein [Rhizobium paknamense]